MEQNRALEIYKGGTGKLLTPQRGYRIQSVLIFCVACGLLLVRIITNLIAPYLTDIGIDVFFATLLQIGILVVLPLFFYVLWMKKSPKEILRYSNMKKTAWFNYLLAAAIGIAALFVTVGISTVWQSIISALGYKHVPSEPAYAPAFFPLSLLLTALLPAVCEEFLMRGGFLTSMKGSLRYVALLVVMGVSFGLFHQNITQVFYTALFGALMAAVVIKTRSIYPAMIIHFFNNGTSVYLDYAETHGWWGGDFFKSIDIGLKNNPALVMAVYVGAVAILAGLVLLMWYLNGNRRLRRKKEVIADAGFDVTNKRVVLVGGENKELVKELDLDKEIYGGKLEEKLFRPSVKDNIFYAGAIVVAVLSTLFTFIWGLIR